MTITLYKKSIKIYLILLDFIFINVHIDGSNKYGWTEEANKFLSLNFNIFAFFNRCFCVRFLHKCWFYKWEGVALSCFKESSRFLQSGELFQRLEKSHENKWSHFLTFHTKINWNANVGLTFASEQVTRMHQVCICTKQLSFSKNLVPLLDESDIYVNQMFNIDNFFTYRSSKDDI